MGLFPQPIYWYEAAAVWSGLVDYTQFTGDMQYVSTVQKALVAQVGPNNDYMPPNQTKSEVRRTSPSDRKATDMLMIEQR